jgi:hypothetical protein
VGDVSERWELEEVLQEIPGVIANTCIVTQIAPLLVV